MEEAIHDGAAPSASHRMPVPPLLSFAFDVSIFLRQLLISAWDKSTSVDVLGHWLSVMHVHDTAGEVGGVGCSGGWLPREQILGEEARRRVPAPFMAQVSSDELTLFVPPGRNPL